ncbi:MAG: hypothetical protein JWO77_2001 [Ilumatobacteraceae bacterium]|nr:hypothetical protein [Ilumatobacteraceae bacterium]
MAQPDGDGREGPTDEALRELLRAEHHRSEIEARRRRSELHRQALESLTLLDVARELGRTGLLADVRTRSGPVPLSTVVEVGRDYVALRGSGPVTRLVPAEAIASLGPGAAPAPAMAPRWGAHEATTLNERMTDLALRRPRVRIAFAGAGTAGQLHRVGLDLVVVTRDDGTDVVVALHAVDEVAL